jgi:hypothetical protein
MASLQSRTPPGPRLSNPLQATTLMPKNGDCMENLPSLWMVISPASYCARKCEPEGVTFSHYR